MKRYYGRLRFEEGWWVIEDAPPHVLIRLKRVFGKLDERSFTRHRLSNSADNARDLEWFFMRYPMRMSPSVAQALTDAANAHRNALETVHALRRGRRKPPKVDLALPLRPYQAVATGLARATGSLLLGDDLGLGKTAAGIGLLASKGALPAVVAAPKSLQLQWEREIGRFAPALRVHRLRHGYVYNLEKKSAGRTPDVLITTYSKLRGWAETLGGWAQTMLLDEGHEVRTGPHKSDRNAATMHIAERARYRMAMTATPIWNYALELYWLCETLRPGSLGTREEFMREWQTDHKGRVAEPEALGSYLRDIGLFLRRTRAEVGRELPALTYSTQVVDSDPDVLDAIKGSAVELARIILKRSEGALDEVSQQEAYVAGGRLDAMVRQATGLSKAPYVAEFVRMLLTTGEKVVLFGWHHSVYDVWRERLKAYEPGLFTGQQSERQKDEAFRRFVDGKTPLLIVSNRAAAGLDGLQYSGCRTVVFGELDWSWAVHEQDIARVWRDGVNSGVIAYFLMAEDGADPIISNVLGLKRQQLEGVRGGRNPLEQNYDSAGARARLLAERYIEMAG